MSEADERVTAYVQDHAVIHSAYNATLRDLYERYEACVTDLLDRRREDLEAVYKKYEEKMFNLKQDHTSQSQEAGREYTNQLAMLTVKYQKAVNYNAPVPDNDRADSST